MDSFKFYLKHQELIDSLISEFNGVPSQQAVQPVQKVKPWSAKKPEIMQMWKSLRNDTPIIMTPIVDNPVQQGDHSTYGEDGIRITGSWNFISSVLAKIKEIAGYENAQTKLRLILRGVDKSRTNRADRQSYVFYANLEKRDFGKPGRPTAQQPII